MCTAISFSAGDHYFGRTLDLEYHYDEAVTVTPRRFPFCFRQVGERRSHYAIIGVATVAENYPLYYDAVNEKGLGMAGLNFPKNAVYLSAAEGADNLAPFEFIPWVLGQCATLEEAREALRRVRLVSAPFSEKFPVSPLHWLIADRTGSVVVEPTDEGLRVYENPVGVLTNEPPFLAQLYNLENYQNLTPNSPKTPFCNLPTAEYSRGLGGFGLPGDLSSASRFVRAAFVKSHAVCEPTEEAAVSQFFHVLGAVEQPRGCVKVGDALELTVYTSCCNTDKGIYYYTTYENRQITAVDLHGEDLNATALVRYPLQRTPQIRWQNKTP